MGKQLKIRKSQHHHDAHLRRAQLQIVEQMQRFVPLLIERGDEHIRQRHAHQRHDVLERIRLADDAFGTGGAKGCDDLAAFLAFLDGDKYAVHDEITSFRTRWVV